MTNLIKKSLKTAIRELKKRLGISANRELYNGIEKFKKDFGVTISTHGGKLKDIQSISTSCCENPFCQAKRNLPEKDGKKCICAFCFSESLQSFRKELKESLKKNFEILTTKLFELDELPILNCLYFRIESFGDLYNTIQARNYIRLARKNPAVTFAWWTKNPAILDKALKEEGYINGDKPENVIFIISSLWINDQKGIEYWKNRYHWIDKEFAVYEPEFIVNNPEYEQKINCGSRQCMGCLRCYTHNDITQIYELLK